MEKLINEVIHAVGNEPKVSNEGNKVMRSVAAAEPAFDISEDNKPAK